MAPVLLRLLPGAFVCSGGYFEGHSALKNSVARQVSVWPLFLREVSDSGEIFTF